MRRAFFRMTDCSLLAMVSAWLTWSEAHTRKARQAGRGRILASSGGVGCEEEEYHGGASLPGRAALEGLDVTNHASALTKNAGTLESDELDNDMMVCDRLARPAPSCRCRARRSRACRRSRSERRRGS